MDQESLRAQLVRLFEERKARDPDYTYGQFGADLARLIKRSEPYKKQYIAAVMRGVPRYPVSAELATGLERLGRLEDGAGEFEVMLVPVPSNTLAMYELHDGSIIMGESVRCATAGCGVWFVPSTPNRRYCPKCHPPRRRTKT